MKRRNSNRLEGYDYSLPGAYFVTVVAHNRLPLLGSLVDDQSVLNDVGCMIRDELKQSASMRAEVHLDEFVVMPDHVHFIVFFDELGRAEPNGLHQSVGAHGRAPLHRKPRSLGSLVAAYKATTTRRYREHVGNQESKLWQRNFFDRIIRSQQELEQIREYILYNPLKISIDAY